MTRRGFFARLGAALAVTALGARSSADTGHFEAPAGSGCHDAPASFAVVTIVDHSTGTVRRWVKA